jgi:hypothetical protein
LIKNGKPVPSSIEKLIVRGLTKKPQDRYDSAEVFLAKVEEALNTPDGGQTDVIFERPSSTTGSQPLVSASGRLAFQDEVDLGPSPDGQDVTNQIAADISNAIDDVLSEVPSAPALPKPPTVGVPAARPKTAATPMPPSPVRATSTTTPPRPAVAGGVGIGLPYTGPTGEPIFGLTPEQRLPAPPVAAPPAKPAKKKRWPLYAGIVGAAIVVGVVIAVATSPKSGSDFDTSTAAGRAQAMLDQGNIDKAIELLSGSDSASDGRAQLVLGNAYAVRGQRTNALQAYRNALSLQPELESNEKMRANLMAMTTPDAKELGPLVEAFDLWIGKTQDPASRTQLNANAVSDRFERRSAVRPVIAKYNLGGQVDRLASFSLDLDDDRLQCPQRKDAVQQLQLLGDPRAIPALERALAKTIKVGNQRGKLANACLADQAKAAISYLKGLAKKP